MVERYLDLSSLIQLFFSSGEPRFDFGSAHFVFNAEAPIPGDKIDDYLESLGHFNDGWLSPSELDPSDFPLADDLLVSLLQEETTLSGVEPGRIIFSPVPTRIAVDSALQALSGIWKNTVALPVPNWYFWQRNGGGSYNWEFFEAITPEQIVDGFEKIAPNTRVGTLLLTNPTVPMGYSLTEDVCKELDRIALRHGVTVVIDEVNRGVQPIGERDSIGRFFSAPYVIEGMSKRFGDGPFYNNSYVLVPTSANRKKIGKKLAQCSNGEGGLRIAGGLLKLALDYASKPAIEELAHRNGVLDDSFEQHIPSGVILNRPSATHLTSIAQITPYGVTCDANSLEEVCAYEGVNLLPVGGFFPQGFQVSAETSLAVCDKVRLTVGRLSPARIKAGVKIMGEILHNQHY